MQQKGTFLNIGSAVKKRNGEMDFLKFLFAVMIVFLHTKNFATNGENIFPGGFISVEFFFIVSGYLMAQSAAKTQLSQHQSVGPATMRFVWGKIKRLIPEFYIAWMIAFIVKCYRLDANAGEVIEKGISSFYELLFLSQSGLTGFNANSVVWFLSAMLLAMLLLYPLLIKNRVLFLSWIAPVISIFLLGWMDQTWEDPINTPSQWHIFTFKGLVRAIAEMSLGCVCYVICGYLKKVNATRFLAILLTITEILCFSFVFIWSFLFGYSQITFLLIFVIAIGVIIVFSQKDVINERFKSSVFTWLGEFSYCLFLGHGFWTTAMPKIFPEMSYWQIMPYYLLIVLATALFINLTSSLILRKWPLISRKIKKLLVMADPEK